MKDQAERERMQREEEERVRAAEEAEERERERRRLEQQRLEGSGVDVASFRNTLHLLVKIYKVRQQIL